MRRRGLRFEGGAAVEQANAKRLVVLHVLPQDLNRGAQAYAGKLRDVLRNHPQQEHLVVTLFAGRDGGACPDIELGVPSSLHRKLLDLRARRRLKRLVQLLGADVLVAHGGEALKYVIAAAPKKPSVYYRVGLSTAEIKRPLHLFLYRVLSRRASRVAGNSRAILEQVEELFGIPESSLVLIPNGRDHRVFRPLAENENAADPPRVLFVGQLEDGKRPSLFLDVVDCLRSRKYRFSAAVAGDGPLMKSLQQRSEELDVQMLGTRSDVDELLRTSAVLVMTSAPNTEGMPGVLIEAGLSGVPAVSSAAAGVRDVIDHGRTGWIVDEGAFVDVMAQRVGALLEDEYLRAAQGTAARQRCVTGFAMAAVGNLWSQLVDELTRDSAAGSRRARTDDV